MDLQFVWDDQERRTGAIDATGKCIGHMWRHYHEDHSFVYRFLSTEEDGLLEHFVRTHLYKAHWHDDAVTAVCKGYQDTIIFRAKGQNVSVQ